MSDELPDPSPPTFSPDVIFDCIKKLLSVDVEDPAFDMDIVMHINAALLSVTQIGIGPKEGFVVTTKTERWTDLLSTSIQLEAVKTYIWLKVRLLFDPPTSQSVLDAWSRAITEFEVRLSMMAEEVYGVPVTEPEEEAHHGCW